MSEKRKILVADDSETIRALLKTALEGSGYEVDMADDGLSAYELGRNDEYDLVIMDQLMPGLLGLEVIERWRDEGMEAPVLMLTGVDDDRTAVESFDLGAVDYVRKPFRWLLQQPGRHLPSHRDGGDRELRLPPAHRSLANQGPLRGPAGPGLGEYGATGRDEPGETNLIRAVPTGGRAIECPAVAARHGGRDDQ